MRTLTLFSLIAFAVSFMAIHIGDSANEFLNQGTETKNHGGVIIFFVIAFIVGFVCSIFYLVGKYSDSAVDHNSDQQDQFILGMFTIGIAVCFGYLYGFAVGPAYHGENAWLDGWLIFLAIGYTPILINLNDVLVDALQSRKKDTSPDPRRFRQ